MKIDWERQYVTPISNTFEEIRQLLHELKTIFPVARIIDPNMFRTVHINESKDLHISLCHCYALWKKNCLLYTSPSPRDLSTSRMPSSA